MSLIPLLFGLLLDLSSLTGGRVFEVVPGQRIGPVALGMSQAEIARLGGKPVDGDFVLGPLSVTLDQRQRVSAIDLNLTYQNRDRLQLGDKRFQLEFLVHTGKELVTLVQGCGRPHRAGDEQLFTVWRCRGIRIQERLADGDPEMTLTVVPR